MFIVRRLVIWLVLLAAVATGANVVLERVVESRLAGVIGSTLDLRSRPDVEIDAFPILLRILQGRLPRLSVEARDLTLGDGFEVRGLSVELEDVHASLAVIADPGDFELSVGHGRASARVTEDAVNAYLERKDVDARVRLREGAASVRADRVVGGRTRRFEAAGTLSLSGRKLSFRPSRVTVDGEPPPPALAARAKRETAFSVEIPKLPGGIVPTAIEIHAGSATLTAALRDYRLRLSET